MNDRHREAFREEAQELLGELESSLLELEGKPGDVDLVGRVFRAMHTIKGSGAMFGFDDVAAFTHDVETIYDKVRNGELTIDRRLIDLTLSACDEIRRMINHSGESTAADLDRVAGLVKGFREYLQAGGKPDASPPAVAPSAEADAQSVTLRIRFKPLPGLFNTGTNPMLLLNELRDLGTCTVVAQTEQIPPLESMDPESCYTWWDILLTTEQGVNAVRDVFIFVEDDCELKIEPVDSGTAIEVEDSGYKKLGEILAEKGDLAPQALQEVLGRQRKVGELLVDAGLVTPEKVQSALAEQAHVREVRQKRATAESAASIRVPAEKLDSLVNMVGELVTVQSRLSQLANRINDLALLQLSEEVERLIAGLRDDTMSIRMLPIGTTFSRFQRLVRDLSGELGKQIVLETEGAETELDKTVIEKLSDPLVHLIRNCIDHGIETPEKRRAQGKPEQGVIHLAAEHSGANVFIRIADDGAGLNPGAIREKAVERGLISPDAALSDKELFNLIFAPGFSTARTVTSVSGRGVGMDVVKRAIDALQGTVDITSEPNVGTTITLKLPLTLAIIDGLLVRIDDQHFILPLSSIEECIELTRADVERAHGKRLATIRGEIVPYIRLRDEFRMPGKGPDIEQIVTAKLDGHRVGFVVDEVVGGHQTVIKSLGRAYRNVAEVSGATILGDGRVALILDLPKLVQTAERTEKRSVPTGVV